MDGFWVWAPPSYEVILESNNDHVKRTDSGKINAKIFMIAMSRKLVMGPRNVWYGPDRKSVV